jgi:hypothetical protein
MEVYRMAKKVTKKEEPASKKPLKKVKSFNLDDRVYNGLMDILESTGTQINLSSFVDEFLRKLYVYLLEADGELKKMNSDFPLSAIVYDSRSIEYFRESNKDNTRIKNLIWSYEASRRGLSLIDYLREFEPEELYER